jgi:cation diffusion facilitator family transporter
MTASTPPESATSAARYTASLRVTLVSVATNLFLALSQIVIGYLGHSQALVADGFHTLSDLVTDFMVLYALWHDRKGADEEHPYGHGRIETAVTLFLSVILVLVALGIAVRAGWRLLQHEAFVTPAVLTLWVAAGTLAAKEAMYQYTMRVAKRFDSDMLRANAWHHRSDAVSSLIVVAGIGGSLIGFYYLDSVAAIVVALMILKMGVSLARRALHELVDTGLPHEDLEAIRRAIQAVNGVKTIHALRTRRMGGRALVDVHIIVDERLSVSEGHQIAEAVRARLIEEIHPVADVMVHIDTEDDMQAPTSAGLPLRNEVLARLHRYFDTIPEARHIREITLHYLGGRIHLDLTLPLDLAADRESAVRLAARFRSALEVDPEFGEVRVRFE